MSERGNILYKRIDRYAGIPLTWLTAIWRKCFKPRQGKNNAADAPKIGVICLGAIGDLVLLSSLIDGLRKKFPKARIEIITSRGNSPALELLQDIDYAQSFSVVNFPGILKFIRKRQYQYLFDSTQWAKVGNILANLSKAELTVGFVTKGQFRGVGYDVQVYHSPAKHEKDNFLALGKAIWPDFDGRPGLKLQNKKKPAEASYQPGFQAGQKIIYCHFWGHNGSCGDYKEWPSEKWAKLIGFLLANNFEIGLTGTLNDREATEDFIKKFFPRVNSYPGRIYNLCGKYTLGELARLFEEAQALISVDTGTMHIGALLDMPVIGLFGPTDPERWGPCGKNSLAIIPQKGQRCFINLGFEYPKDYESSMKYLKVDDVIKALKKLKIL